MTADMNQESSTGRLPYPAEDVDSVACLDEMLDRRLDDLDEFLDGYFRAQLTDPAALAALRTQYEAMLRYREIATHRAPDDAGNDVAA